MRVRATATGTAESNSIGQVELECTPAGLALGLYGVGPYTEGYATGALTRGTRFTIPYSGILAARQRADHLYLELSAPGLPYSKLTLTRFTAGPGVPVLELRRRRLILQFVALSVAALACLASSLLIPAATQSSLAFGALGYGVVAGALVLLLGYSLNQQLFSSPPGEEETREAFLSDLERFYPRVLRSDTPKLPEKPRQLPNLAGFLPRTTIAVGVTLAATILTALVVGQRMYLQPSFETVERDRAEKFQGEPEQEAAPSDEHSNAAPSVPSDSPSVPATLPALPPPTDDTNADRVAPIERRCMCERPYSQLWEDPIPRLSTLLIEQRSIKLKNHTKTELQLAVINNGDSPISEITLHVQFYEQRGKKRVPTKERPLYFEGPLAPGAAIKWTTEARGTEYEVRVPEFGNLGQNGDGAAPAGSFFELLEANHRPVRLHAARLLSYLGDPRAREGALELKDAMRAAEAPYLRRILAATGDIVVCDVQTEGQTAGACVYNASAESLSGVGVGLNTLSAKVDVDHPLADPPSFLSQMKWQIKEPLPPKSGVYVRVPKPTGLETGAALEVTTDLYDLLD